jgi:ParB family chromosome partitioning protein
MKTSISPSSVTVPSTTHYFPLSALFLSGDNVRKGEPTSIEELAATIEAQGLLQALHVTQQFLEGTPTGRYAVEAGGRRLRSLQWLACKGRIAQDFPVECKLIAADRAVEVSLTENTGQEPMHPADEFDAFAAMVGKGQSIEAVAAKFGVTTVHIQRRLKLANVAPQLLALYRADGMTLDQIMALASVDDHERQMLAWNGLSSYNRTPQSIKRKLCEDEVVSTDPRAKVVGLENYINAGGSVRSDLFSEVGDQYLTDMGLLELMLGEKLEQQAEMVRAEGWAWVEVSAAYGYEERRQHGRLPNVLSPETPEQEARRIALESQMGHLSAELETLQDAEEWDESQGQALEDQIDALEIQLGEVAQARAVYDTAHGGAVVSLDENTLVVHRGLYRQADRKSQATGSVTPVTAECVTAPARPDIPERLMMDLTSHRTAAIQASMLKNQPVALASLAHKMADSLFGTYQTSPLKISLTQSRSALEKNSPTLAKSRAATEMDAQRSYWDSLLPQNSNQRFVWFLGQEQDVVLSFIVFASANSVEAVQGKPGSVDHASALANALSLDMADWWEATPETYFDLVPKTRLMAVVTETSGEKLAAEIGKMKKGDAVLHAVEHTQGRRWLPQPLRCVVHA